MLHEKNGEKFLVTAGTPVCHISPVLMEGEKANIFPALCGAPAAFDALPGNGTPVCQICAKAARDRGWL